MSCCKGFCTCYMEGLQDGVKLGFKRGYISGYTDGVLGIDPPSDYQHEIAIKLATYKPPPLEPRRSVHCICHMRLCVCLLP